MFVVGTVHKKTSSLIWWSVIGTSRDMNSFLVPSSWKLLLLLLLLLLLSSPLLLVQGQTNFNNNRGGGGGGRNRLTPSGESSTWLIGSSFCF